MSRQAAFSGSPFEAKIGFARAVRTGPFVCVGGTAPIGKNGDVETGIAAQTRRALLIVEGALKEVGASLADVTRTRVLLTDIGDWEEAGRVHGEFFGAVRPVTTFMEVSRFIDPRWLIEIEADAYISGNDNG
jgi:enamine deaminase RidA (YjgF/YER057c/UK114 family)